MGGGKKKSVDFFVSKKNNISTFSEKFKSIMGEDNYYQKPIKIQMLPLKQLIKMFGTPNFCKIDAEGSEEEILKSMGNCKIPLISFEYTKKLGNINNIQKNLKEKGYRKYNFSPRSDYYFIFKKFEKLESLTDALKLFEIGEVFAY